MIKNHTTQLLNKEMDRKDFLKHVGIALLAVAGVSGVLSTLSKLDTTATSQKSSGYGGSAYGR